MNGYTLLAESYKKLLLSDKGQTDKADLQRKIDALEALADADDGKIYALFDTSAFNDIVKGYAKKALDNLGTEKEERQKIINEIAFLFDTFKAEEAENYYYNN